MQKRAVFYEHVIFWEQSGQADAENGAMLITYLFRYTSECHFVVKCSKKNFSSGGRGHWPPNQNPADVPDGTINWQYLQRSTFHTSLASLSHWTFTSVYSTMQMRQRVVEHSNSRFESIRFDSLCESIRIDSFCKKSAFRFTSCHAVFLFIYCIDSAKE